MIDGCFPLLIVFVFLLLFAFFALQLFSRLLLMLLLDSRFTDHDSRFLLLLFFYAGRGDL